MILYYDKKTPRKMCETVAEAAKKDFGKLARRPWNRFEATYSPWWLVPSAKQPTHEFGKLYFDWGDKAQKQVLGGLYLEKGLDPSLSAVYPSKKGKSLIMKKNWAWYAFFEDLQNHRFEEKMVALMKNLPVQPEFHIDGGYVEEPSMYDPYDARLKNDYYILNWDQEGNMDIKSAKRHGMLLKALNKVRNFNNLLGVLEDFNQDQWLWLNIFVAFRFEVGNEKTAAEEMWTGRKIWQNILSCFSPWLQ